MFLIIDKGKNMLADRTVIRNNHVIGDLMKTVKKIIAAIEPNLQSVMHSQIAI